MKNVLVLAFLFFFVSVNAQQGNYTIKGKIGTYNAPAKVYLNYIRAGQNTTDSAQIKKGVFEFKGTVNEPFSAILILDYTGKGFNNIDRTVKPDVLNVYIEKGIIAIQSADSISKAKISGSALNNDNQKLRALLLPVQPKINAINKEYQSASQEQKGNEAFTAEISKRYEAIQEEQKNILKEFIKKHPASYVSLDVIGALAGEKPDFSEVEPLFNALSPKVKQSTSGKALSAFIQQGHKTSIGSEAADFTQNDIDGKPVKLSDFRGKYVLLDFWASWCGPCRQENPNVVRVFNKYKDRNFTVLGVSLDRSSAKGAWLKAIKDDKLTWTQVSDLKSWQNEVAVLYGVQAIPQNFLIDPQGKIVAKNLRGEELDIKLAELIK